MKRFIVFLFPLIFLFASHTKAADYTFNDGNKVIINLSVQATTANATITFNGDLNKTSTQGDLTIWKTKTSNSYSGQIFKQHARFGKNADLTNSPKTVSFPITTKLEPKTTYYLIYQGTGHPFTTELTDACTPDPNPVAGVEKLGVAYESGYVVLSNKFDATKHPCYQNFKASIEVSKDSFDATKQSQDIIYAKAVQNKETKKDGIASNGEFYYYIANIDPSTTYYFKQTIEDQSTGGKKATSTGNFPSTKGYEPIGSTQQSFEENSYRLLAPFPGFTVVMDPELCAAKKARHELSPDAICDVNDLLNFAFKLLIGAAAVLLIFRLMLAGYQYVTTDVPFLKNTAKTHLGQSALGILLALSAYLILNTINPKLVTNNFKLAQLNITIDEVKAIRNEALEVSENGGIGEKLCTDVASCKALCTKYGNDGSGYTGHQSAVLNPSSAQKIENIPLVTATCKNCTASSQVLTGLKNLKPTIDSLISSGAIKKRSYTFAINSAYRSEKDQIRVMCTNPATGKPRDIKADDLGSLYAYPTTSNHGKGTAVDVQFLWDDKEVINCGATRKEGTIEKIMDGAGFQRLNGESWHFEYGGGSNTCKYPNCGEPKHCSL